MATTLRRIPPNTPAQRAISRRTALAGAASALVGAALARPVTAVARQATTASPAAVTFEPALAGRLQEVMDEAIVSAGGSVPGMVAHVEHAGHGSWSGAAGLAQLEPDVPMTPEDRFGAGSIVKPFVAATILQLVEGGALALADPLTGVLPADVTDRFPQASEVTVEMLLGHRSGLPDWSTSSVDAEVAADPGRIWTATEFLDLAAAQEPAFAPGTAYAYSNTNYTLLGLVVEEATGRSWREEVTDRVIAPLELTASALPAPGDRTLGGPHAHGYAEVDGTMLDVTQTDPSMAGAAGGNALVTSVTDLVRFMNGLLAGHLFQRRESLEAMLRFQPAEGEPGQVGYGLGLLQRVLPGGIETIDHLGGAVGYIAYVGRLLGQEMTVALAINATIPDPSPFIVPVLETLAGAPG